mmetsp:Transcript_25604/g.46370  ORF Transcript_25604/g.46370 Transcript_25604/m.46370 type:complete len:290 (+) Transcript_25604:1040-1909(+)
MGFRLLDSLDGLILKSLTKSRALIPLSSARLRSRSSSTCGLELTSTGKQYFSSSLFSAVVEGRPVVSFHRYTHSTVPTNTIINKVNQTRLFQLQTSLQDKLSSFASVETLIIAPRPLWNATGGMMHKKSPTMSKVSRASGTSWRAKFHARYGRDTSVMYTPGNQLEADLWSLIYFLASISPIGVDERAYPSISNIVPSQRPPFPINTDFVASPRIIVRAKKGINVVVHLYHMTPRYVLHSVMPVTLKSSIILSDFRRSTSNTAKAIPTNPKVIVNGSKSSSIRKETALV